MAGSPIAVFIVMRTRTVEGSNAYYNFQQVDNVL